MYMNVDITLHQEVSMSNKTYEYFAYIVYKCRPTCKT